MEMGGSVGIWDGWLRGRWVAMYGDGWLRGRWVAMYGDGCLNREIGGYVGLFYFTIWHLGKPSAFPPSKPIPTKPIGKLKAFVLF